MPKSGNNIFYRKDGRWEARYFKDYDRNNHIIYGYVYGESYDDAKEKRDKILEKNDYSNNKINKRQNKTLESLIEIEPAFINSLASLLLEHIPLSISISISLTPSLISNDGTSLKHINISSFDKDLTLPLNNASLILTAFSYSSLP